MTWPQVCYNWGITNTWPGDVDASPAVSHDGVNAMTVLDCSTIPEGHKVCRRCGVAKPLTEMVQSARCRDGYAARCKACHNGWNREIAGRDPEATRAYARAKANRLYRANPEPAKARHRAWIAENREHCVAYALAWQHAHPESKRASDLRYAAGHRTQACDRARKWKESNRDRVRSNVAARKARVRGARVGESVSRASVWARDGGRCHLCGKRCDPKDWHLDHIVPIVHGGAHSYQNVAVSHPTCNLRKNDSGPSQMRLLP